MNFKTPYVVVVLSVAGFFASGMQSVRAQPPEYFDLESVFGPHSVNEDILSLLGQSPLSRPNDVNYAVRITVSYGRGNYSSLLIERGHNGAMTSVFKRYIATGRGNELKRIGFTGRRLSDKDFFRLTDEIERQNFFSVGEADYIIMDGPNFLIEVYDGQKYHAADRSAFEDESNTPFGNVARVAREIAHIHYK